MDQQQWNCVVGACCCEENCAAKRRKVLEDFIVSKLGHRFSAAQMADLMLTTFDVMPAGTLKPMIEAITSFVQAGPYQG